MWHLKAGLLNHPWGLKGIKLESYVILRGRKVVCCGHLNSDTYSSTSYTHLSYT